jgi:hypothetical protein
MPHDVLREGFRLAHRRLRLIFLDLLWKAIWFVLTIAALLLAVAWLGSEFSSIGWMDTGNRGVNTAIGYALVRQFWAVHRREVFGTIATVLFLSVLIWFVLEAAFRARFPLPLGEGISQRERVNPRFYTFLLSNTLKCLLITTAAISLAAICFGRYLVTPLSEWRQLWVDTRGAALAGLVTLAALGFLLTILETVIRSDAIELLGTDLFRLSGLIGILLAFEAMISGSCAAMVGVGFLNIAGWRNALVMLGTGAIAIVFMNVLHSYLLLVRFSAVGIMRQNVVEV